MHWLATQIAPPPVQVLTVPGAAQAVPGLVELAEQRPAVVPAVHTLLHSSSPSSMFRQPPPGQSASRTQEVPGTLDRKSQVPLLSSLTFENPPRLSPPPASRSSSTLQNPGQPSLPLFGGPSRLPSALASPAPESLSK